MSRLPYELLPPDKRCGCTPGGSSAVRVCRQCGKQYRGWISTAPCPHELEDTPGGNPYGYDARFEFCTASCAHAEIHNQAPGECAECDRMNA